MAYRDVALSLRETLTARLLVGAAIVAVMAVASTIAREFTENLASSKRCVHCGIGTHNILHDGNFRVLLCRS